MPGTSSPKPDVRVVLSNVAKFTFAAQTAAKIRGRIQILSNTDASRSTAGFGRSQYGSTLPLWPVEKFLFLFRNRRESTILCLTRQCRI